MIMDTKHRSRKFILAMLSLLSGIVALFAGYLSGGEFLGLVGLVLGLYGAANVAQNKQDPPK